MFLVLGNESGISALVIIRKETGNLRVSGAVLGDEPGISALVVFRKKTGNLRVSDSRKRIGNIRTRGNSERDRESPCLLERFSCSKPGMSVLDDERSGSGPDRFTPSRYITAAWSQSGGRAERRSPGARCVLCPHGVERARCRRGARIAYKLTRSHYVHYLQCLVLFVDAGVSSHHTPSDGSDELRSLSLPGHSDAHSSRWNTHLPSRSKRSTNFR